MNFELAKRLKDAGFPYIQKKVAFNLYQTVWNYIPSAIGEDPMATDHQIVPTLSELVEACGDDFELVRRYFKYDTREYVGWMAECTNQKGICASGCTAEEAVANLWLALNSK